MTDGSDFPKELISIDLTNGEWSVIPIDFNPQEDTTLDSYLTTHCWSTSGAVAAFAYGKTVYLVDSEGQLIHAIYTGDEIAGIHFASDEDSVYLISHHAQITKCRLSDGVCLTEIQPEKYRRGSIGAIDQEKLRWKYLNDSTLIIFTGDDAFLLDIAGEELKMKAAVSNCFAYNPWENRLIVSNKEGFITTSIGSLPYYSLDELIQQANKLLKIH